MAHSEVSKVGAAEEADCSDDNMGLVVAVAGGGVAQWRSRVEEVAECSDCTDEYYNVCYKVALAVAADNDGA